MSKFIIGDTKARFYQGEKYKFEYVGGGEWKLIEGRKDICPFNSNELNREIDDDN